MRTKTPFSSLFGIAAVFSTLSLLSGCGEDSGENSGEDGTSSSSAKLSNAPDAVRVVNGRRFRLIGAVTSRAPYMTGNEEFGRREPPGRPPEELTLEELENAIRGRSLINGHEYEEEDVEDRAQLLYDHLHGRNRLPEGVRQGSASNVAARATVDATELPSAVINKNIINTDTRTVRANTTVPGTRNIVLAPADATITSTTGSRCTIALIGRSTAISAAHCFWNPDTDQWRGDYAWAPGFDSQDADIDPLGQTNRCYSVLIPAAYQTANGSPIQHDYAVIDFNGPCALFPGDTAGWYATKFPEYTNTEIQQTFNIWGYPARVENGITQNCGTPAVACNTRLWGSSGILSVGSPAYIINHSIDTTGGQSGSAVWRFFDGQEYTVGMHKGGNGSGINWARRIDATVNSAIDAWSSEY